MYCCVFVFSCTVLGACHIRLCLQATLLARQEKFGQVKSSLRSQGTHIHKLLQKLWTAQPSFLFSCVSRRISPPTCSMEPYSLVDMMTLLTASSSACHDRDLLPLISAYFLAAACDKRMRLLTSFLVVRLQMWMIVDYL